MKKFLFNSVIRKQQPKGIFIEAICKSCYRHLSISIIIIGNGTAKKYFCYDNIFKIKIRISMFFLVLSYGISTTLLQKRSSTKTAKTLE